MTTDSEIKAVRDFALSDPRCLRTALAIYDSWPEIKKKVCEDFLRRLCIRVQHLKHPLIFSQDGEHSLV